MNEFGMCKCKKCGGDMDPKDAHGGVLKCKYCGARWTIPNYHRGYDASLDTGDVFLESGNFNEAYNAYKQAAKHDPEEPEAYFRMAQAEFRVQFLKDEVNDRLQPICFDITDKIFTYNENYRKALSLATPEQRELYRTWGMEIDDICDKFFVLKKRKISYDCFICVKVSAEQDGDVKKYTDDYHRAYEIYMDLKSKGYKPFLSQEVLKDETGSDYEAHILYALLSAPTMLVVCGNEEYLNTVWVKNEYTRYLKLMSDKVKEGDSLAIVCLYDRIERLPGVGFRMQVIESDTHASERITNFIEKHCGRAKAISAKADVYSNHKMLADAKAQMKLHDLETRQKLKTQKLEEKEKRRRDLRERKEDRRQEREDKLREKRRRKQDKIEERKAANREKQRRKPSSSGGDSNQFLEKVRESSFVRKLLLGTEIGTAAFLILLVSFTKIVFPSVWGTLFCILFPVNLAVGAILFFGKFKNCKPCLLLATCFAAVSAIVVLSMKNEGYSDGLYYDKQKDGSVVVYVSKYDMETLTIPETIDGRIVSGIAKPVFRGSGALKNIQFPEGFRRIEKKAFEDCYSLVSVTLTEGILEIGDSAFEGCGGLKEFIMSDTVVSVGKSAFARCSYLASVTFSNSIARIESNAFKGCTSLQEIVIPASMKYIEYDAFTSSGLTNAHFEALGWYTVPLFSKKDVDFSNPATAAEILRNESDTYYSPFKRD